MPFINMTVRDSKRPIVMSISALVLNHITRTLINPPSDISGDPAVAIIFAWLNNSFNKDIDMKMIDHIK